MVLLGFARAHTCLSDSIPTTEKTEYNGTLRWKVEAETCSAYWNQVGTDCAICMAICPYSKPDTPLHSVIRWLVNHSWLAPKVFPAMDDILYARAGDSLVSRKYFFFAL